MKRVAYASAMLSVTLLLTSSTAGASITKKAAGKQYLKDVAPLNTQITKFNAESDKWTSATTDAQGEKAATPLIAALRTLQNKLLSQSWPSGAKHDVRVLYNETSSLEADLLTISTISDLDSGSWASKFANDATKVGSDANIVRHDLGLPLT